MPRRLAAACLLPPVRWSVFSMTALNVFERHVGGTSPPRPLLLLQEATIVNAGQRARSWCLCEEHRALYHVLQLADIAGQACEKRR